MAKRKALDETASLSTKRLQVEAQEPYDDYLPDEDEDNEDATSFSGDTINEESVYTATTALTTQSRKFPSDIKSIPCTYPDCSKTFNRPARLAAHLRSHTDDRPFKCTHCDKDYREEKHLRQHIKGSHSEERSYKCTEDGCEKSFLTATRLRRHQAVHEGAERYRCRDYPPCTQSFRKHNTLQRHVRTDHLNAPAYPCTTKDCSAGFDKLGALRKHIEREHGPPQFWCDECEPRTGPDGSVVRVGFTTIVLLQTHIRKEHINCIFCEFKCSGQWALEKHIEMHHSGISVEERKTIECTWEGCDKKFTKKSNLTVHIRSAHEGFRYICGDVDVTGSEDLKTWQNEDGCGNGFVTKANLEDHIRFVHMGYERPKASHPHGDVEKSAGSRLDQLIGATDGAKRTIPCTTAGCELRFIRYYDLNIHVQNVHANPALPAMEDVDARVLNLAAANTPVPDQQPNFEAGMDMAYGSPDPVADDVFWIGASDDFDANEESEMWYREEAEMRALIDDELDPLIDPALR